MAAAKSLSITTSGERAIVISRHFDAPPDAVFDAYTIPALVRRWLLGPSGWTMTVCDIDLVVGGKYRYVWQNNDGRVMGMGGVFKAVERPHRLVCTELFDEDWTGGETLGTLEFNPDNGGTLIRHTVLYPSAEGRAGALQSGMERGLDAGFLRLDDIFAKKNG